MAATQKWLSLDYYSLFPLADLSLVNCLSSVPALSHVTFLHTAPCSCKCKTFLLPNITLSHDDLTALDSTPFGAKIVALHATMLGLFLHSPNKQATPLYDDQAILLPPRPQYSIQDVETAQTRKALTTSLLNFVPKLFPVDSSPFVNARSSFHFMSSPFPFTFTLPLSLLRPCSLTMLNS